MGYKLKMNKTSHNKLYVSSIISLYSPELIAVFTEWTHLGSNND